MGNEKKLCILLTFFIFKASAINFKEWVTVNTDYRLKTTILLIMLQIFNRNGLFLHMQN